MSKLLDKLHAASTNKLAGVLSDSMFFNEKDMIPTAIPALNIALSGSPVGGLTSGITFLAGPSRHFKSLLGLVLVKAYMSKYPDAVCLFVDSEFGITPDYMSSIGIDIDRVLHVPVEHIEQLKFDLSKRLESIERGDKVIVFIDSVGNLASKKEVEDALDGKSAADMTRAKQLKSLFRIITPHFTTKDIPCVVVNHTYMEMALFPKAIMSGGTGPMYSANQVFIIGKQQEKKGTELLGYNFIINIEKSRFVKEKSKIPITVTFDGGVSKWSGLLDIAQVTGHVTPSGKDRYSRVNMSTGEVEELKFSSAKSNSVEFWQPILRDPTFTEAIEKLYKVGHRNILEDEDEVSEVFDESEL